MLRAKSWLDTPHADHNNNPVAIMLHDKQHEGQTSPGISQNMKEKQAFPRASLSKLPENRLHVPHHRLVDKVGEVCSCLQPVFVVKRISVTHGTDGLFGAFVEQYQDNLSC